MNSDFEELPDIIMAENALQHTENSEKEVELYIYAVMSTYTQCTI